MNANKHLKSVLENEMILTDDQDNQDIGMTVYGNTAGVVNDKRESFGI